MYKLFFFSKSQQKLMIIHFCDLEGVCKYFALCSDDIDFVDHFVKVVFGV